MKNIAFTIVFAIILIFTAQRCANPGTPSGGPKDEKPPVVLKSTPPANALNYRKGEVEIEFDELIQLKEVNQKLVISPPVNKFPTVVPRGNKLSISFQEDLQENTTYTLDFADAIADNNEGNVLPNYRFSFSTGNIIDSMAIGGHIWQASDFSPVAGAMVFIHENLSDTAFRTLVPIRLAKTDEKGAFSIRNVKPGNYRLFALEDNNRDYKYNQPGERIAWLDSLVVPSFEYRTFTDSISPDSTTTRQELAYTPDSLKLFLFQEVPKAQYMTGNERKEKAKLSLFFNLPVENFSISQSDTTYNQKWHLTEKSLRGDTLSIWITDPDIYNQDSLTFQLRYTATDSLFNLFEKKDTLTFYYFEKKEEGRKKRSDNEKEEVPALRIQNLDSSVDINGIASFQVPTAPVWLNPQGFHLLIVQDTIKTPVDFELLQDSLALRRFTVSHPWIPGQTYQLDIDSASIRDVYNQVNHTLTTKLIVKPADSYGTLYFTIAQPQANWLIQILNDREKVIRQAPVPANGKIAFQYMKPGDYMIRIVMDVNQNGNWDTGDYSTKTQPEQLFYFPDKIQVRANWDREVKIEQAQFNIYEFSTKFRKSKTQNNR